MTPPPMTPPPTIPPPMTPPPMTPPPTPPWLPPYTVYGAGQGAGGGVTYTGCGVGTGTGTGFGMICGTSNALTSLNLRHILDVGQWDWVWHGHWLLHILDDLPLHCAYNFPHLFNWHWSWHWHLPGLWDRDRTADLHSDWVGYGRWHWHRIWCWHWKWAIHNLHLRHIDNLGDRLDAISSTEIALRGGSGCQSKYSRRFHGWIELAGELFK